MPLDFRQDERPDAPTRLAESKKKDTGDRFESLIYHLREPDLFLMLDIYAEPEAYDWVVTEIHGEEVVLELYDGQGFIGRANLLEFYKLQNSEQWRPQIRNRFTS